VGYKGEILLHEMEGHLFVVLMYQRGAHLSVTWCAWLEVLEISRGVNVTFCFRRCRFIITVSGMRRGSEWDRELGLKRSSAAAAFLYDDKVKENDSGKELIAAGVYLTWLKNTHTHTHLSLHGHVGPVMIWKTGMWLSWCLFALACHLKI